MLSYNILSKVWRSILRKVPAYRFVTSHHFNVFMSWLGQERSTAAAQPIAAGVKRRRQVSFLSSTYFPKISAKNVIALDFLDKFALEV